MGSSGIGSLKNCQFVLSCDPHMGGCQNYGPFLGTLNIKCRIVIGIQKGTLILTTTHIPTEDARKPYPNYYKAHNLDPEP